MGTGVGNFRFKRISNASYINILALIFESAKYLLRYLFASTLFVKNKVR